MPNVIAHWTPATGSTHCEVTLQKGTLLVDVDAAAGGGHHPSPHDLLDSALAACTTLTLELYIQRKGMAVSSIRVEVDHVQEGGVYRLSRRVEVTGDLSDDQRASLLRIAEACPVHKTLSGTIAIDTVLQPSAAP
ncbi:MAG: OsmC family peroxiredoxin [Rubrivivax sp.]|nr:MAG: OsmC family peroxiredoxin [Rubrivivax sp.]